MELPSHPESEDPTPHRPEPGDRTVVTRIFIAVVVALIALVIILHLTGVVGPGAH